MKINRIGRGIFNVVAIALCVGAIGIAVIFVDLVKNHENAGDKLTASIKQESPCAVSGNAKLLIGGHIFEIPQNLRGAHLDGKMFSADKLADYICPNENMNIIKTSGFSVETASLDKRDDGDPQFSASIIIRLKPEGATDLILSEEAKSKAEVKDGFLVTGISYPGTGVMGNSTFFTSTSKDFITPNYNPVTIGCYQGKYKRGRECYTWFSWSKTIQIEYKFYDGEYAITEWGGLHSQIVDFIKKLDVTSKKNNVRN